MIVLYIATPIGRASRTGLKVTSFRGYQYVKFHMRFIQAFFVLGELLLGVDGLLF